MTPVPFPVSPDTTLKPRQPRRNIYHYDLEFHIKSTVQCELFISGVVCLACFSELPSLLHKSGTYSLLPHSFQWCGCTAITCWTPCFQLPNKVLMVSLCGQSFVSPSKLLYGCAEIYNNIFNNILLIIIYYYIIFIIYY